MVTKSYVSIVLIILSITLIMLSFFRKNDNFFNVKEIAKSYFSIFSKSKSQYITFYALPLVLAVGLAIIYEADKSFYENSSVIVSIFLSMLLAILSILTSKEYGSFSKELKTKVQKVVKETINAIVFDSLLCIVLLLYCLIMIVIYDVDFKLSIAKNIFAGISYYGFAVILLNLLLIIKRMGKIIEVDINHRK